MFNSGILDIAIGLIFIFLLLSLVCSAINEIIEAKLKMRASDLELGIRELLSDRGSNPAAKDGVVEKFYQHPLIFGLFIGSYDPAKVGKTGRYATSSNLPSYIPSKNFALTLLDLVLPASDATASGAAGVTSEKKPASATGAANPALPLQPLREAVGKLENQNLKQALLPLIDAAGDDANKLRQNIEDWFNSGMDRVSGWYKRRVQWIILVLGFGLAVATNADTITIARSLSYDVSMRNSLVAAAQELAKPNAIPAATSDGRSAKTPEERIRENLLTISQQGVPLGWREGDQRTNPSSPLGWLTKFLGWLITAAAISLGAPFWFDALNRFMIVRSTVKPHEKSPEEPAIDRK